MPNNYLVTNLATDRGALAMQITAVETAINTNEGAIADRETKRAALKERIRQFNQMVRGAFPGSQYARMLPKAPSFNAAPGIWIKAVAAMNDV